MKGENPTSLGVGVCQLKGVAYGTKSERKWHDKYFVSIPKEEINRQIKDQEMLKKLHTQSEKEEKIN